MGKLMSKGSEGQNLPYIPDNTLAQLTVKELNKKVRQMETQVMITLVQNHDEEEKEKFVMMSRSVVEGEGMKKISWKMSRRREGGCNLHSLGAELVVELVEELVEGEGGCNLHSLGAELGERRGDCLEAAEENSQKQRVRLFKFPKLSKTEGKIFQICFHTSFSCLGSNF